MNKRLVIFICLLVGLTLSLPVAAQDAALQETIPVSGTFSYTYEMFQMATTTSYIVRDATESEVWSGDLEGTSDAIFRVTIHNNPSVVDVWLISNFSGTLLGDYEGTLTIILVGDHPISPDSPWPTQWYGEWAIVGGTGDLANVHGHGIWWGPGNSANDQDLSVPKIGWQGEVVFMEPLG